MREPIYLATERWDRIRASRMAQGARRASLTPDRPTTMQAVREQDRRIIRHGLASVVVGVVAVALGLVTVGLAWTPTVRAIAAWVLE